MLPRLFALVLLTASTPAIAQHASAGDIQIRDAWSRATPGGATVGAGYMTIKNDGITPDRLISASSTAAGKVEIHEMAHTAGVMTMRQVSGGLLIDIGNGVQLAPGGYHLMLIDLKAPLRQGDKIPVTMMFQRAGAVDVMLEVRGLSGQPAPAGHSGH